MTPTIPQANRIYDILVREAGASNREFHRTNFVSAVTGFGFREFRFCGALGWGGKFWNTNDKWYVTAYSEDMNYQVTSSIQMTNAALSGLKAHYTALEMALGETV